MDPNHMADRVEFDTPALHLRTGTAPFPPAVRVVGRVGGEPAVVGAGFDYGEVLGAGGGVGGGEREGGGCAEEGGEEGGEMHVDVL